MSFPQNTTTAPVETAYIALGSNLDSSVGTPAQTVRAAIARLQAWSRGKFTASSLYQSVAEDCPANSPDFINAVVSVELDAALGSQQLLLRLQTLESEFGRQRTGQRNAPRTLDLDLIAFGDRQCSNADLELPHPRAHLRRFVLEPLAEINPGLVLPGQHETVAGLLRIGTSDGQCRLAD